MEYLNRAMAAKIFIQMPRAGLSGFLAVLLAGCLAPQTLSAQPTSTRDTLERIDPKAMRQLLAQAKEQPDVALTNIVPVDANRFRFVFVWPAEYTMMTEDRINRSFAQRFLQFTSEQKFLATAYCLTPPRIGFLASTYGEEKVNMAFRNIEVYRDIGWRDPCRGKLVTAAEIDELRQKKDEEKSSLLPLPPPVPNQDKQEDSVAPFLKGIKPPE
jgi:hypothetical protein